MLRSRTESKKIENRLSELRFLIEYNSEERKWLRFKKAGIRISEERK